MCKRSKALGSPILTAREPRFAQLLGENPYNGWQRSRWANSPHPINCNCRFGCYHSNTKCEFYNMSTTSLKLPQKLKDRAVALAKKRGISTHAFLLGAIEKATEAEEARMRMITAAKKALTKTLKSGKGYAADEVHQYIRSRVRNKQVKRPQEDSLWRD